jgi:superfamily II DNA/RNA helicase
MTFAELDLDPTLLRAVQASGYTEPTPIQARAIPEALAGRDLLASAQTGTGKTAAFMLPALQRLVVLKKGPKGAPRVLVLTPTRELAAQVLEATRTYGRHLRLRSAALLGGAPYREQFRALAQPIDLVVATPGRLIDHLERGSLSLGRLELLILDEADRMLDMGFRPDVEKITAAAPAERQTLLFTATLGRTMAELAAGLLKEPVRIDVAGKVAPAAGIEQRLHVADNLQHKHRLLQALVADGTLNQAIIFAATKRDADSLARDLATLGHRAAALHGDMTQGNRNRTVQDLRRGRIRLLVATDVAARGLDVNTVSHVINFDLPKFAEDYVHRIGRTGRAGATGIAISLAAAGDLPALQRIQRYLGHEVPQHTLPGLEPTRPLVTRPGRNGNRSGPGRNRTGRPGAGPGHRNRQGRSGKGRGPSRREPVVEFRRSR